MGAVVVKDQIADESAGFGSGLRLGEVELGIEGEASRRESSRSYLRSLFSSAPRGRALMISKLFLAEAMGIWLKSGSFLQSSAVRSLAAT